MEKLNERLDTAIRIALLLPDCVRTIENFYRDGFGYTSRKSEVSIVMGTRFVRQCAVGCWAGVDVLVAVADLFGTVELLVLRNREARWPGTF
jgi:hypothetical protein